MSRSKEAFAEQWELDRRIKNERAEAAYFALHDLGLTELGDRIRANEVDPNDLTREQLIEVVQRLAAEPGLARELHKSQVGAMELAVLAHRRSALSEFERLLHDDTYFDSRVDASPGKRPESVWQELIEANTWILGYGLAYVLNAPLDGKRLEQVVAGASVASPGKRVDALLKSRGSISALSFGEIKTHRTRLLKDAEVAYRSGAWQISDHLAGGITQVQRSVQLAMAEMTTVLKPTHASGAPTGERLFLYQPRSFLVVGALTEFETNAGIHEEKYSSFELFRRNVSGPEIITFDELYERAKFIVNANPES